jgi:hypothetical protein
MKLQAATAISPTIRERRGDNNVQYRLHHLPLLFRNLVQDLLICIFDRRRKTLNRLQVRPKFILERVADAINGEIELKICSMLHCKESLPELCPGRLIMVNAA